MDTSNTSQTTNNFQHVLNRPVAEEKHCSNTQPSVASGKNNEDTVSIRHRKVSVVEDTTGTLNNPASDHMITDENIVASEWNKMSEDEKISTLINIGFFTKKDLRTKKKDSDHYQYYFEKDEPDNRKQAYIPNEDVFLTEYYINKWGVNIFLLEGEDKLENYLERLSKRPGDIRLAFIFKTTPQEGVDPSVYAIHYIPVVFDKVDDTCSLYILDSGYNHTSSGMKVPFSNTKEIFKNKNVYFTGVSLQSDTASCGNSAWAIAKEALRCKDKMDTLVCTLTDKLLMEVDNVIPESDETYYNPEFTRVYPVGALAKYTQRTGVIKMMANQNQLDVNLDSKDKHFKTLRDYLNNKGQPKKMLAETLCIVKGKKTEVITEKREWEKYMQLHKKGELNLRRTIIVINEEFLRWPSKNLQEIKLDLREKQKQLLDTLLKGSQE